jgi:ankyrin repeat protein
MIAAVLGDKHVMKLLLQNPHLDVNVVDNTTGVNAFWLAAYYGKGNCLQLLAASGANVYCKHNVTHSNALHISIANKHYNVAMQLTKSKYPANEKNRDGVTPLLMTVDDTSESCV